MFDSVGLIFFIYFSSNLSISSIDIKLKDIKLKDREVKIKKEVDEPFFKPIIESA